ncbi:MATE family efflux transporter [uncultured Mailhella sp.]|uniref:MATE family efflux transporter n=1 Tax=uncultured Mailhella sp. TaxID=1981031 RepID=UPI0025E7E51B|nr:MATE family efflux transporter [uncultured Mailhella sp.]
MHRQSDSMTGGSIWKSIVSFAVPLILGNFFQQLYNAADSLIVGNLLGDRALAAVSGTGNLIFLLVGFINGISLGAGVVISQQFGAGKIRDMRRSIHTLAAFGLASGLGLSIFGVLCTPQILHWMNTPADVFPETLQYLRVYFAGALGLTTYNALASILQAVGNSRYPLYFLILSSVVNIVLDLVFIALLHWGVWSAAAATVISQILSALLCTLVLCRSSASWRLAPGSIRFHAGCLKTLAAYGFPSGLQCCVIGISNVVIQSHINLFGASAMAGCGAYQKIEGFCLIPVMSLALALATFVGQNTGAHHPLRVRAGMSFGLVLSMLVSGLIGVGVLVWRDELMAVFSADAEVIRLGADYARVAAPFYVLPACTHCLAAAFRGAGRPLFAMAVILICWCAVRVGTLSTLMSFFPTIATIYWIYPATWTLSSLTFLFAWWRMASALRNGHKKAATRGGR